MEWKVYHLKRSILINFTDYDEIGTHDPIIWLE